jgi:two-component system response regulator RstA
MADESERVMLVEDDLKLARLITKYLQASGYRVSIEAHGDRAVNRILSERPDLVVLDIMLPGLDGLEVCRGVRKQYRQPILMLTARGDESDELLGLEAGADDYLSKPVRPELLLARIRALLRRARRFETESHVLTVGSVVVDAASRSLTIDSKSIDVTTTEFELIWCLVSHAGEVVTRDQLSCALHGYEWDGSDRSVDLAVSRLRGKLRAHGYDSELVLSVHGVGYQWTART